MPQAIGVALLTAIGSTLASSAIAASIVGTVVLTAGALAVQALLPRPGQAPTPKPNDVQQTVRQPIPGRRRFYGRVKVAGPLMFYASKGGRLFACIAINSGEIDAFEEHWLGDKAVTLGSDGDPNLVGGDVPWSGVVSIYPRTGTATQAAHSELLTFDPLWTAAHQGKGVADALVIYQAVAQEQFPDVYPGGAPPYRAVIRASKVFDPREVGHDHDDPATWEWADNPALCLLDYMTSADGMRLDLSHFDLAEWVAGADVCDELVSLAAGGTERRYSLAGGYDLSQDPVDVISQIGRTFDGYPYQKADGTIGLKVGKWAAPTVTIADEHIIAIQGLRQGVGPLRAANEIRATFMSPDHDYQETECDPWRDEADISARGEVLSQTLDLTFVPSHTQARRLMKVAMHRVNPAWTGRIVTNLYGLKLIGERFATLQIDDLGIDETVEVTSFELDLARGQCVFGFASLSSDAYDWTTAEEGTPPVAPDPNPEPEEIEAVAGLTVDVESREVSGSTLGAVLVINWDAPTRLDLSPEVQFRRVGDPAWSTIVADAAATEAVSPFLQDGATYEVQVRFVAPMGGTGAWDDVTGIVVTADSTAPATPTAFVGALDGTSADLSWTAPNSANFHRARVYRGSTALFADAVDISGAIYGAPLAAQTYTDAAPGSGTWRYWVTAENASGADSSPAGPQTVVVP